MFRKRTCLAKGVASQRHRTTVSDPNAGKRGNEFSQQFNGLQNVPAGQVIQHARSGAAEAQRAALSTWLGSAVAAPSQQVRYGVLDLMATKDLQPDLDITVSARNRLHELCHDGSLTTRSQVARSAEWQQQMRRIEIAQNNVNAFRDSFVSAFSERHAGLTWAQIEATVAALCPNSTRTVNTIELWAAEARSLDPVKVHRDARNRAYQADRAIRYPHELMIHR